MYDFTTWHRRVGIGAEKWEAIERAGITDPAVVPFSVADMEWETAPEIQQALVERATTAALVPDLERQIAIKESELAFITGSYPKVMERSHVPLELSYRSEIPIGVPSQLLERRPDLRQAEQDLRAAEAAVGVAQAERFPTFTISLAGGTETNILKNIISAPYYMFNTAVAAPLFQFGRRKANFKAAIAVYNQKKLEYEKSVMQAFKEVYDATVSYNSAIRNTALK